MHQNFQNLKISWYKKNLNTNLKHIRNNLPVITHPYRHHVTSLPLSVRAPVSVTAPFQDRSGACSVLCPESKCHSWLSWRASVTRTVQTLVSTVESSGISTAISKSGYNSYLGWTFDLTSNSPKKSIEWITNIKKNLKIINLNYYLIRFILNKTKWAPHLVWGKTAESRRQRNVWAVNKSSQKKTFNS